VGAILEEHFDKRFSVNVRGTLFTHESAAMKKTNRTISE
jgi:hypothetical protein